MNFWAGLYKVAAAVLAAAVVASVIFIVMPRCSRLREMQRRQEAVRNENVTLEDRIQELRENRDRFASEQAFVERTAREAGMAKPDETIYKFVPAATSPQ